MKASTAAALHVTQIALVHSAKTGVVLRLLLAVSKTSPCNCRVTVAHSDCRFEVQGAAMCTAKEESEQTILILHLQGESLSLISTANAEELHMRYLEYCQSVHWFCGIINAEGCFSVSLVKDYPRPQLVIGVQSKEKEMSASRFSPM